MTYVARIAALVIIAIAIVVVVIQKKRRSRQESPELKQPPEPEQPQEPEPEEPEPEQPQEPEPEEPEPEQPQEPEPEEPEPEQPQEPEPEEPEPEQPQEPEPEEPEPEQPQEPEPEEPEPEQPQEPEPEEPEPEQPQEPEPEEPEPEQPQEPEPEEPEPEQPQEPEPEEPEPEQPQEPEPEEPERPGLSPTDHVAPYVPPIRTPETTKRRTQRNRKKPSKSRSRKVTLQVAVRAVFARRNIVHLTLLPARGGELEEEILVDGPDGEESWFACQDEWYGDFVPSDIGQLLENGIRWTSDEASWVLSPRELVVLAPNSTIFGFVSATRLLLNEDHLVLCREGIQDVVREELGRAGCAAIEGISARGIPGGWVLFKGVRPTIAVAHEQSAGIFNALRPIEEVEICLEGGIRLTHKKWLNGYPPRIRVRGGSSESPDVTIDGDMASSDRNGNYEMPAAFDLGQHVVFCGGVTAPFEIVEGKELWDPFVAYAYSIDRKHDIEVSVCGPIVMGHGEQTLVPDKNRLLIGAQPGEAHLCEQAYGQAASELIAITEFPVVWALPNNPYQCNKSRVFAQSVAVVDVGSVTNSLGHRPTHELLLWCSAILNCSRKGMRTEPSDKDVSKLWSDYVRAARQIWRSMK